MTVQTRQQRSRTRRRLGRDAATALQATAQAGPAPVAPSGVRERAAGGPQDQARYQCACGCVFEAPVSTTVGCPRCGAAQDW